MNNLIVRGALLFSLVLFTAIAVVYVAWVRVPDPVGFYQPDPLLPGDITRIESPRPTQAQAGASRPGRAPAEADKQILFGDAHVHTTWSFDAFMFSLPVLNASRGALPPAAACDYARFVSQLDFFFLTDHAESYTARRWRDAQDAVRQCNAVAGDPDNPDLVAFIGFEWSQFGRSPEQHYGHHNVLFRDIEAEALPARPIGAAGAASDALRGNSPVGGFGMLRWLDVENRSYYEALARFTRELREEPDCPTGIASPQLPVDCYESAGTPGELYRKLDEWGFDTLVVPHGSSWGIYTPPGASWDHQLTPANHDPAKGRLIEVYSGHGNSESYRDFSARVIDEQGRPACPEPKANYLPSCWQAGNIIRDRCLQAGESAAECETRAATARQHYVEVEHVGGWKSVPGTTAEEWLDSGQARDVFLPAFNYRPGKSVQYGLAKRNFSDPDNPIGYRWGLISSTDTHFARAGNGFKQTPRVGSGDAGMRGARNDFWDWLIYRRNPEAPAAQSRKVVNIPGDDSEQERKMSFLTAGGVVAVHARGRDRGAIWDAMGRREVYGTSGHRILLWFDLLQPAGEPLPMGSELTTAAVPEFRVTAVGSFKQLPGCPDYTWQAVSARRLEQLARGECYHPSDERYLIDRIEVVRIRPQISPGEPIADLVEDTWLTLPCEPDPAGCTVTFRDETFVQGGRDALYYVRAIEEPSPTVNGANLRPEYDQEGEVVAVNPCYGDFRIGDDDCHAPLGQRAWSSPIFLTHKGEQ